MQATTTKTISTISYNTKTFLTNKLNELKRGEIIVYGFFIRHEAEQDEAKAHYHVILEPNGKVNLTALRNEFIQKDPNNEKPLGVMPFQITQSYDDWILYALHDPDYLLTKGMSREYHYQLTQVCTTEGDEDILQDKYNSINHLRYSRDHEIYEAVKGGASNFDLLTSGLIPLKHMGYYNMAIEAIRCKTVYRHDRITHTPKQVEQKDEHGRALLIDNDGEVRGIEVGCESPFDD